MDNNLKSFFKSVFNKQSLDPDELRYLIEIQNKYFIERSKLVPTRLLNEVTLDVSSIDFSKLNAAKVLESNGIVVLKNFFQDRIQMESVKKILNDLADDFIPENSTAGKKASYSLLAKMDKPHVTVRGLRDYDSGMIDIFRIETSGETIVNNFYSLLSSDTVREIINSAFSKEFKPENLNAYINKGVRDTRDFHVDSYKESIKVFLYLTDVSDLSNGPYSYVLGSHKDKTLQGINRKLAMQAGNPSDTTSFIFNSELAVPILGQAGSLVISDQQGVHRGFPQEDDQCERVALVLRFNSFKH